MTNLQNFRKTVSDSRYIYFSLDVHKGNRKENSHFSSSLLQKLAFIHCCSNCPL